jgi:hypothetical protein
MAKHPDWLKVGEGFADITLSRAADFSGTKMTVLRMRESTVEDTLVTSEMDGTDAVREVQAFANLLEQSPADIRKLPMRDFKRLQVAYLTFID